LDSLDKFLRYYVEKITAERSVPIDLESLIKDLDAVLEEREMIPEAAMLPLDGRFHIYMQSNFKDLQRSSRRRRFTLAHEIGHTLFFERRDGELKVRRDAPRGEALEAACHRAASMILIPTKALAAELRDRPLEDGERIRELADRFDVSIEVMMRRLNELSLFGNNWAPVLARRKGEVLAIEFAANSTWLNQHLSLPKRGSDFFAWFRASEEADGVLRRRLGKITIEAQRIDVSGSLVVFELRESFAS
jgi:Zn-dependent peptidase ImmA (M78 family)